MQENAFRNHFQTGGGADGTFLTHAVAHQFANILTDQARKIAGKGARGNTAGFQKEDSVVVAPAGMQQPEGDAAAFARTRRRADDGVAAAGKRLEQRGAESVNGRCREQGGGAGHAKLPCVQEAAATWPEAPYSRTGGSCAFLLEICYAPVYSDF